MSSNNSTNIRPIVKRQYGSKKSVIPSITSLSSSPRIEQLSRIGAIPRSNSTTSSDWNNILEDEDSGYGEISMTESTNNSSSPRIDIDMNQVKLSTSSELDDIDHNLHQEVKVLGKRTNLVEKKVDLRSFFKAVSPTKKRRASDSDEDNSINKKRDQLRINKKKILIDSSSSPIASTSTLPSSSSIIKSETKLKSLPKSKLIPKPKLSQLYLDPFETTSHATMSCTTCSMSYARTPEDIELHSKHHKRVVGGCDWISLEKDNLLAGNGGRVVQDSIEWGGKEGGKIVMVDATTEGLLGRRISDILSTIDRELSATSLTPNQLLQTKLFLFITPQRKVIAAAVVQRIESSYQVISSKSILTNSDSMSISSSIDSDDSMVASSSSSSPTLNSNSNSDLLRFGEEEGAVFCSNTLHPTLLGVHRIWTSSSHRSQGLATLILNSVANHFIYGCPISKEDRGIEIAFSQPTASGMRIARKWTGTEGFRVFVE